MFRSLVRAATAVADLHLVHSPYGRDLRRGSGEKFLVGYVQEFPRNPPFLHLHTEIRRNGDRRVPGDPREDGVAVGGGENPAVADDEDVLAAALTDQAVGAENDSLVVAVRVGLHAHEL